MADYSALIEKYKKELEKDPNKTSALSMLARIAFKEGRFSDSRNYYEVILLTKSEDIEALYMLGCLYMKKKDNMVALDYFNRLISSGINNPFLYEYAAILDSHNRKEYFIKALDMYDESRIRVKDHNKCVSLSLYAFSKEEYEAAEKYGILALTAKNTVNINNILGCIYYKLEDYDKALSFFHDVNARLDSKNVYILCNIACCYKQKRSHKMALRYLDKAKELDGNNKYVYLAFGEVYIGSGDNKKASDNLTLALDIDPDYANAKEALSSIS